MKLMDVTMMNDLRKSGHVDFGSHSSHHLNMAATPDADMKEEIRQSKEKLEKILPGISVYMFAYPFGGFHDISNKAIKALLDVGFKIAVTTIPGTMNSPAQLLKLRRVQFTTDDSLSIIKAKLNGDYDWYIVKDKVMYYLRKMLKLKVR